MLTIQQLKDMEPDTIFATGTAKDEPGSLNMARTGQELHWVAIRGGIHDWAIYVAPADWEDEHIASSGDKVHDRENIKKLVECDEEALGMYRN
jgi:hypothetical protein